MFAANVSTTIWNRWHNPSTKKDEWFRFAIPVLVRWKSHTERNVAGTSASVANTHVVIMPPSDQYKPESEWGQLPDKTEFFTLQKGDLLALGDVDVEITGIAPNRESDVKTALSPNVMTIKSIEDNTRVAHGRHFRLEGF